MEQQIQICVIIGCRSSGAKENRAYRIDILPLSEADAHLMAIMNGNRAVVACLNSTLKVDYSRQTDLEVF